MNELLKTIRYQHPSRIPVSVSFLPATWEKYGDALNEIRAQNPLIFGESGQTPIVKYYTPETYHAGTHVDAWGCVWSNIKEGYEAIVTGHPLKNREDINTLRAPKEDAGLPHGFMFLRLFDLRGFEEMMIDFAEEPPELQLLIDIVRDYNVRQMKLLCQNSQDEVIWVGDDNGIQDSMPISPALWRKYIYPAYKAIYDVAHQNGRTLVMHTDGCIWQVMPDMQKAGADMINPQFRANGLNHLKEVCKGKIPIDLDLDRQMFPFATPDEIKAHIRSCTEELYLPEGGLMLFAECAADVPLENIKAICEALSECTNYQG